VLWKADVPSGSPGVDAGTEEVLSEMCHVSFVRETEPQFESFDSTICDLLRPATCRDLRPAQERLEKPMHPQRRRSTAGFFSLGAQRSANNLPHMVPHHFLIFPHHSTFEHFEH